MCHGVVAALVCSCLGGGILRHRGGLHLGIGHCRALRIGHGAYDATVDSLAKSLCHPDRTQDSA